MDSYDIIANAVRDYVLIQMKNDRCIDNDYIVHFYQKYEWENKWWECTEIVSGQDLPNGTIEFSSDFCEGQTEVKDIVVMALYEVGDLLGKALELAKERINNENRKSNM